MCFEIDAPFSSAESAVLCCGVFGGLFSGGLLLFSSSCCGLSWFGFGFLVCYFNWELFLFVVWGILMFFWRALCFSLLLVLFLEVFGVLLVCFVSFSYRNRKNQKAPSSPSMAYAIRDQEDCWQPSSLEA